MVRMCCYYKRAHPYINIVDEINIIHTKESIKDLINFLQQHQDQRVNLCIPDTEKFIDEDMPVLIAALEEKSNLVLRLPKDSEHPIDESLQDQLKELNLPFYYTEIASDWDVLNGLIAQGVTDVFVGNNLGFELDKVAAVAKEANVKMRVYPNIAQSTWNGSENITKFFIRPEDLIFYSKYVNCFEFYEVASNKLTDSAFLYDIYKLQKKWTGDLQILVPNLHESIDNRLIDDQWAYFRVKCGKSCAKGGPCRMCYRIVEMSEKMSEKERQMNRFLTKKLY